LEPGIKITAIFPVSAKRLYDCWLNSNCHSTFTGEKVQIEPRSGTNFSIQGGYITGSNLILQPYGRIVQIWRNKDFPAGAPDSKLEILFEKHNSGTKLTIIHLQVPEGLERKIEKSWKENYLKPMRKLFQKTKTTRKARA
jgi:activator of HSP90 ATPase